MLTKEECDNATTRLYRPYFASTEIQNSYYDINGKDNSINDDCNLIEQLIHEHFKMVKENEKLQKEEMQHMANGIILTCHIMMSDILCKNDFYNRKVILNIFSETGITKDEFKNCDDEISKNTIIELFNNEENFYREMGWI